MSQIPNQKPEQSTDENSDNSKSVVEVLIEQDVHLVITESYRKYIREKILPLRSKIPAVDNLPKRHEVVLLSTECHHILLIIWKESQFVTDEDLTIVGMERNFEPGAMNCHSLGCQMAREVRDFTRAVQSVQNIVAIAECYGLVEEVFITSNKAHLTATKLLHDLFTNIGVQQVSTSLNKTA